MRRGLLVGAALAAAALVAGPARADEVPYNVALPFLTGPQQQGMSFVFSVAAGGWGGKHLTFTYTWERCDESGQGCMTIPDATTTTELLTDEYVEAPADVGHTLRVLVTATNSVGSTSRWSNASPVVPLPGPSIAPLTPSQYGTLETYAVYSPALGRTQQVAVYLPPGYARSSGRRYPVLYLLHGYPGSPNGFEHSLAVPQTEDELLAARLTAPLVIVMPYGAPDALTETSWLDSPNAGRWETFVTGDVVRWVDGCFAVNVAQSGRGVAGLSDGGFGALDMAIHHPGEFRLAESWSGYEHADAAEPVLAGASAALLRYDSPAIQVIHAAAQLRRRHVDFWLYIGADDSSRLENAAFAAELASVHIAHTFTVVPGSHLPSVYRANLPAALREAGRELAPGTHAPAPSTPASCPPPLAQAP